MNYRDWFIALRALALDPLFSPETAEELMLETDLLLAMCSGLYQGMYSAGYRDKTVARFATRLSDPVQRADLAELFPGDAGLP